jgi:nucleotide-binding universal stress UspA family protein
MSYRSILVPVAQPDNAASALEAAFLVAKRFAGHVSALHVVPDLADPATHALMATRMSLEAATSDFRKFKGSAERELQRQASELKRLVETAAERAGAPIRGGDDGSPDFPRRGGRRSASRARWWLGSAASSTLR